MRRLALPLGAVLAASLLAACGSASHPVHHRSKRVSASVIAGAARRTAAEPGFAIGLTGAVRIDEKQLRGSAGVRGSALLPPTPLAGEITLNVTLPGQLGLLGTIKLQLLITGGTAYVKLPSSLAAELPGAREWMSAPVADVAQLAGISPAGVEHLDARGALELLARDSTGTALDHGSAKVLLTDTTLYSETIKSDPGLTVYTWIKGGLIRRLELRYSGSSGLDGTLQGTFVFETVTVAGPPPAAKTSSLLSAVNQLKGALSSAAPPTGS